MPAVAPLSDEEKRLREKLQSKGEVKRLRDKLLNKHTERIGSSSRSRSPREFERRHNSPRRSSSPPRRDRQGGGGRRNVHHRGNHHARDHRNGGRERPYPPPPPPQDTDYWRGRPPHRDDIPPRREYDELDPFGRRPPRSYSRSRSRERGRDNARRHKTSHHDEESSYSSRSSSTSRSSSGSSSVNDDDDDDDASSTSSVSTGSVQDNTFSKDQRTVFVTQLTQKTTRRQVEKYFKHQGLSINETILLRDKHTGKHKGSAYVELKHMKDVSKACSLSGQAPDFQRFPILIKASEAEKNYVAAPKPDVPAVTPIPVAAPVVLPPLQDPVTGRRIQAQKVYVGNLETSVVTSQHLQALFAPFGTLQQVHMPVGKGYAFLQYHDPKEAALAIQTMSGQNLAGKPLKTGWATNQVGPVNVDIVTSTEFPPDAAIRAQNAYLMLAQLTAPHVTMPLPTTTALTTRPVTSSSHVPTVAEARASLALSVTAPIQPQATTFKIDPTQIGNAGHPSRHLLVHNMFDKDEETDEGWEKDLQEEFQEECSKYGTMESVVVASREPGGKTYASFVNVAGAQQCASILAGRWFDKRQLRVEFVNDADVAKVREEYASSL